MPPRRFWEWDNGQNELQTFDTQVRGRRQTQQQVDTFDDALGPARSLGVAQQTTADEELATFDSDVSRQREASVGPVGDLGEPFPTDSGTQERADALVPLIEGMGGQSAFAQEWLRNPDWWTNTDPNFVREVGVALAKVQDPSPEAWWARPSSGEPGDPRDLFFLGSFVRMSDDITGWINRLSGPDGAFTQRTFDAIQQGLGDQIKRVGREVGVIGDVFEAFGRFGPEFQAAAAVSGFTGGVVGTAALWTIDKLLRANQGVVTLAEDLDRSVQLRMIAMGDTTGIAEIGPVLDVSARVRDILVAGPTDGELVQALGLAGKTILTTEDPQRAPGTPQVYVFDALSEALRTYGVSNPWIRNSLSVVGDLVLDPATWLTLGARPGVVLGRQATRPARTARLGVSLVEDFLPLNQAGANEIRRRATDIRRIRGLPNREAVEAAADQVRREVLDGQMQGFIEQGGLKLRSPFPGPPLEKTLVPGNVIKVPGGMLLDQMYRIPIMGQYLQGAVSVFVQDYRLLAHPGARSLFQTMRRMEARTWELARRNVQGYIEEVGLGPIRMSQLSNIRELLTQPERLAAFLRADEALLASVGPAVSGAADATRASLLDNLAKLRSNPETRPLLQFDDATLDRIMQGDLRVPSDLERVAGLERQLNDVVERYRSNPESLFNEGVNAAMMRRVARGEMPDDVAGEVLRALDESTTAQRNAIFQRNENLIDNAIADGLLPPVPTVADIENLLGAAGDVVADPVRAMVRARMMDSFPSRRAWNDVFSGSDTAPIVNPSTVRSGIVQQLQVSPRSLYANFGLHQDTQGFWRAENMDALAASWVEALFSTSDPGVRRELLRDSRGRLRGMPLADLSNIEEVLGSHHPMSQALVDRVVPRTAEINRRLVTEEAGAILEGSQLPILGGLVGEATDARSIEDILTLARSDQPNRAFRHPLLSPGASDRKSAQWAREVAEAQREAQRQLFEYAEQTGNLLGRSAGESVRLMDNTLSSLLDTGLSIRAARHLGDDILPAPRRLDERLQEAILGIEENTLSRARIAEVQEAQRLARLTELSDAERARLMSLGPMGRQALREASIDTARTPQRAARSADVGDLQLVGKEFDPASLIRETPEMRDRAMQRLRAAGTLSSDDVEVFRRVFEVQEGLEQTKLQYGFIDTLYPDYLHHTYRMQDPDKITRVMRLQRNKGIDSVFEVDLPFMHPRRVETLQLAQELGLDPVTDIAAIMAIDANMTMRGKLVVDFERDLAETYGRAASDLVDEDALRTAGYNVVVGGNSDELRRGGFLEFYADEVTELSRGELRGVFLPRDIALAARALLSEKPLTSMVPPTLRKFIQAYDFGNRLFKGSVTRFFSFVARNSRTNVVQNYLDLGVMSLSPSLRETAIEVAAAHLFEGSARLDRVAITAADGSEWTLRQIRELVDEFNVMGAGHLGLRDLPGDMSSMRRFESVRPMMPQFEDRTARGVLAALAKSDLNVARLLYSPDNYVNRVFRWFNSGIENHDRIVSFLGNLKRTGSPEFAAQRVNKILFDYMAGLTWSEREIIRRIMPFYTFPRKAAPLAAEMAIREPGRTLAPIKLMRLAENTETDDTDPARRVDVLGAFSVYQQEVLGITKGVDENGEAVLITGIDLPIDQLNFFFRNTPRDTLMDIVSLLSPLLRAPMELFVEKVAFTNGPINDPELQGLYDVVWGAVATLPTPIGDAIRGFLEIEPEPYTDPLTGEERVIYAANPQRVYQMFEVMGSLFGLRRLTSQGQRIERAVEEGHYVEAALDGALGLRVNRLDMSNPRPVRRSKMMGQAFETWQDAVTTKIDLFHTPGQPLYGNVPSLMKGLAQFDNELESNIEAAESRRVARLSGTEEQVEAIRQELARVFRAPGLKGAIDVWRQQEPRDLNGDGVIDGDEWGNFFDDRDLALWDHAERDGGDEAEVGQRYLDYQRALRELRVDRLAQIEDVQARGLMVRRFIAQEDLRVYREIPRYLGQHVNGAPYTAKDGEHFDDILEQVRNRMPRVALVSDALRRRVALRAWASEAGPEGSPAYQTRVNGWRVAQRAARHLNPEREQYLILHPDVDYFFIKQRIMPIHEWNAQLQGINPDEYRRVVTGSVERAAQPPSAPLGEPGGEPVRVSEPQPVAAP